MNLFCQLATTFFSSHLSVYLLFSSEKGYDEVSHDVEERGLRESVPRSTYRRLSVKLSRLHSKLEKDAGSQQKRVELHSLD